MARIDWTTRTPFIWDGLTKFTVFQGVAKTLAKSYHLTAVNLDSASGVGYALQSATQHEGLLDLARQRLNNHKLRTAKKFNIPTMLLNGVVMHAESFDGAPNRAVCLVCGNHESWSGSDEQMTGTQSFGFGEDDWDEEGDADYSSYDSEIGSYTEITCNVCDEVAWRLPRPTQEDAQMLLVIRNQLIAKRPMDKALITELEAIIGRVCAWSGLDNPLSSK